MFSQGFTAILCWDIHHFPYGHSGGRTHFQTDISPVLVLHPIYITTIFIVLVYDISMIYTLLLITYYLYHHYINYIPIDYIDISAKYPYGYAPFSDTK